MKTMPTLVITMLLAFATVAQASWVPDGVALCTAPGDQWMCQITSDGFGGAIVAWSDYRRVTQVDFYAQRVDATGFVRWLVDGVPICTADGIQAGLHIISDGAGGAFMAWGDERSDITGYDIYAQRVDALGNILWEPDGRLICGMDDDQGGPHLVSDGAGGAIMVWGDYRNGNSDIYAQRIDAGGVAQWTPGGVAVCDYTSLKHSYQITTDGDGGVIVTWQDHRSVPGTDIYAQRVDSSGVRQWAADGMVVCEGGWDDREQPQITFDGAGGAIIAWEDHQGGYRRIYAQHVNGAGAIGWAEEGVVMRTAAGTQSDCRVVSDGDGGAIVTWRDYLDGRGLEVFAQRVDSTGVVQWTEDGAVVCVAESHQEMPTIALDGARGAIVTWMDFRNDGQYDIYAQHLDASGAVLWKDGGVPVCTATGGQGGQQIVYDGTGGAVICWKDPRGEDFDIYAQRVPDGITAVATGPFRSASLQLFQNHPNPFNPTTAISFTLPGRTNTNLSIYNIRGKLVTTLVDETLDAGFKEVTWLGEDARGNPVSSGVYFYRLTAGNRTLTKKMVLLK